MLRASFGAIHLYSFDVSYSVARKMNVIPDTAERMAKRDQIRTRRVALKTRWLYTIALAVMLWVVSVIPLITSNTNIRMWCDFTYLLLIAALMYLLFGSAFEGVSIANDEAELAATGAPNHT